MRFVVDLVVGINALGAIVGFTIRRARKSRHDRAMDRIHQIEEENDRYDALNRRINQ